MKNYYEDLGINKNATIREIKKAYKTLAKAFHPDMASNTEPQKEKELKEKFTLRMKAINEAYDTLSD